MCNSRSYRLFNRTFFFFFKLWNNVIVFCESFWTTQEWLLGTDVFSLNHILYGFHMHEEGSEVIVCYPFVYCRQQNLSSRFSKIESKCLCWIYWKLSILVAFIVYFTIISWLSFRLGIVTFIFFRKKNNTSLCFWIILRKKNFI